jgi:KUP system potassium uptake protein
MTTGPSAVGKNPFFAIMPEWFLFPGVIIATIAAIIASQAIISGSFTIVKEAISLNFWPILRVLNPTFVKGQVYLPLINWFLWLACSMVVIFFRESANMEAAYGLSINLTEMMTTLLVTYYLFQRGLNHRLVSIFVMVYLTIETSFLIANLHKFSSGGWFTLMLATFYLIIMVGWYFGRKLKNRFITFSNLDHHLQMFRDLREDESVPPFATNLVYIIRANKVDQVESKVIYSIFHKQPKRADKYWFLHINKVNEPNRFDYKVTHIIPGILIRIDFNIGFKIETKINLYFREVLDDLIKSGEITIESSYESLRGHHLEGDFRFILIDRVLSRDYKLNAIDGFILSLHNFVRRLSISDIKALQLDSTVTAIEQVPIIIDQAVDERIARIGRVKNLST